MTDKYKKPHFTGSCTTSFSLYSRNKISYDGQLSLQLAVRLLTTLCALTNAICSKEVLWVPTQDILVIAECPVLVPLVLGSVSGRHVQCLQPDVA